MIWVHLLAALDHHQATVLGQRQVLPGTSELLWLRVLGAPLPPRDTVVTADALHATAGHARWLVGKGAHYLLSSKPTDTFIYQQLATLGWDHGEVQTQTSRGHGRTEQRTLRSIPHRPRRGSRTPFGSGASPALAPAIATSPGWPPSR